MISSDKKQGPGKGPTNLSGVRGASPVLRVRVPTQMMDRIEEFSSAAGVSVADWVRELIDTASNRKIGESNGRS